MTNPEFSAVAFSTLTAIGLWATSVNAQASATDSNATLGESQITSSGPKTRLEPAGTVAGRVVAEALMGTGLATVGYLVGPKLAGTACRNCIYAASFAGASATFPIGVYWGGHLVRGNGSFLLTVGAPWIVSITTVVALLRDGEYDGRPAFEIGAIGSAVTAPLSIVAYELSHLLTRPRPAAPGDRIQLAAVQRRGGMELLMSLRF
ncbi:MAG TPA: hypothetical protein VGJ84_17630 [Polyangiaceae bacterium]|jgi:hypothetical protein